MSLHSLFVVEIGLCIMYNKASKIFVGSIYKLYIGALFLLITNMYEGLNE